MGMTTRKTVITTERMPCGSENKNLMRHMVSFTLSSTRLLHGILVYEYIHLAIKQVVVFTLGFLSNQI